MGLTYFGYDADQYPAAHWLKPNSEDKNVSPWQMTEYVNTQTGGTVCALDAAGRLRSNDSSSSSPTISPCIIEEGYDPPGENLGWMGHYLLVFGYDDATRQFTTQDSYEGPNLPLHLRTHRRVLAALQPPVPRPLRHQPRSRTDDAARHRRRRAAELAERARQAPDADAVANQKTLRLVQHGHELRRAWAMYDEAAAAYDQARNVGEGCPGA